MKRKIINLKNKNMTFGEVFNLKNYIWKGTNLIPKELEKTFVYRKY